MRGRDRKVVLIKFLMRYARVVTFFVILGFVAHQIEINSAGGNSRSSATVRKTLSYESTLKTKSKVPLAAGRIVFHIDLQDAIPSIGANNSYELGYTGKGIYVAVIDTGIEVDHAFLADKVALEACFSSECPNGETEMYGPGSAKPVHWHGTHVAGIIAGSNGDFHGVAPDVKIIAINVFDKNLGAIDENTVKALAYVGSLTSTYNIAAVNMSLGGNQPFNEPCDTYLPSLTAEIHNLRTKNVATVISSGNNYSLGMSSPACISEAVSVAATYTSMNKATDFSNVSEFTTLSAPGYRINSSKTLGSYGMASGTSMAAPFVTGAFAVYRSKYGIQSVANVVAAFQSAAVPAIHNFTKIITKRLDLRYSFEEQSHPNTTITTSLPSTSVVAVTSSSSSTTMPDVKLDASTPTSTSVAAPIPYEPDTSELSGTTSSTTTSTSVVNDSPQSNYQLPITFKKTVREIAALAKLNLDGSVKTITRVLPTSARYCKVVGVTLVGLKTGICKVTVTAVRSNGRKITKSVTLVIA